MVPEGGGRPTQSLRTQAFWLHRASKIPEPEFHLFLIAMSVPEPLMSSSVQEGPEERGLTRTSGFARADAIDANHGGLRQGRTAD